jgi:hypothetical protein
MFGQFLPGCGATPADFQSVPPKGWASSPGRIVQQRNGHQILLDAQMPFSQFAEFFGNPFINLPVGTGFPGRVNRRRQGVNKGVHVRGVHVVLFVPGGRRQYDIGIHAGGRHAEIQGGHQIQLADSAVIDPFGFVRFKAATFAQVFVRCTPWLRGAQQMTCSMYSCPLPDEPSRLERQMNMLRG